jgi:hypothetical protein
MSQSPGAACAILLGWMPTVGASSGCCRANSMQALTARRSDADGNDPPYPGLHGPGDDGGAVGVEPLVVEVGVRID